MKHIFYLKLNAIKLLYRNGTFGVWTFTRKHNKDTTTNNKLDRTYVRPRYNNGIGLIIIMMERNGHFDQIACVHNAFDYYYYRPTQTNRLRSNYSRFGRP